MGRDLDVKQATASRILNGLLVPGRDLMFAIQALYFVPVAWWGEEPAAVEDTPLPMRPARYGTEAGGETVSTFRDRDPNPASGGPNAA